MQGEPEYVKYWNEVQSNPELYKVKTIGEALDQLKKSPKTIYVSTLLKMSSYYQTHYNLPGLKVITEPLVRTSGLIFTKNSPLAPMFQKFGLQCINNGLRDRLIVKWFGKKLPNIPRKEKTVLSLSHTFLSFMFVAVSFFVSFIVFVFECVYKKYATKSLKK